MSTEQVEGVRVPVGASSSDVRGPGRPRDQDLDDRILAAALELVDAGAEVTVSRVVAESGVSRAALYRRWPSMTALLADALDVGRTIPQPVDVGTTDELRDAVFSTLLGDRSGITADFSERRFRRRIQLAMENKTMQRAYWRSHVVKRRAVLEDLLRQGVDKGLLRADLDAVAAFDLVAGVFYYQLVVRGDSLDDPVVRVRCRLALDIAWRGMTPDVR